MHGHFRTALRVLPRDADIEGLRVGVTMFIEEVVSIDAAIAQMTAQHFGGQDILFPDARLALKDQIEATTKLCALFNLLADDLRVPPLDLQRIREDLESGIEEDVSTQVELARLDALSAFPDQASQETGIARFVGQSQGTHDPDRSPDRANSKCESGEDKRYAKLFAEQEQQARTQLQLSTVA